MHVYVRAVEPVKCGTVILLQQIDMSADSARQCEQRREAVAVGLHCCLLCQVKSQGTTHLHVYVRAVEPVKCGTIILLQQIDMSSDSARQYERLLLLVCIVGLASCSGHAEHC